MFYVATPAKNETKISITNSENFKTFRKNTQKFYQFALNMAGLSVCVCMSDKEKNYQFESRPISC